MFTHDFSITNIYSIVRVNCKTVPSAADYSGKLNFNELIFKLDGNSEILFDGRKFNDKRGSVRFLPKTGREVEYKVKRVEAGSCIDIYFETNIPIKCEAFSIRSKSYERMAALFKRAEGAWRQKKRGYTYTAVGCLYEIFGLLYEESVYVPNKQLEKIQLGIDYINEHFTEDFEVDRLSDMCKISHTYFKKIFNNAYNMPPKAYITQLRIRYACDLLKSGKYKIGDIAEEVGYKNVYYFSKVFKAQTGSTPSEYKKNVDDGGTK